MQRIISSWGKLHASLGGSHAKSWMKLVEAALEGSGILSLDPRLGDHAEHIQAKLGSNDNLSSFFPRKAAMMEATSAAFDLHGGAPQRTLLHMTPEEAGCTQLHPYVGIPHFAFHSETNAVIATGVVSHPSLLHALEMVLEIVDADTGKLVGSTSIPPQFNTHYQRVTVTAPLHGDKKPRRLLAGLTTNYVVDGQPYATPLLAASSLGTAAPIVQVTPFAPLPIKHPGATQVKIAIDRDGSDVDYSYQGISNPNEIIVPFSGQAQLASGFGVTTPPCQQGTLVLIARSGGALPSGAQYALSPADVIAAFAASQGAIVTWSMGPDWQQSFVGNPQSLGNVFDIQLKATLNVKSATGPTTAQLILSSFGSVSPGGALFPLYIQWGCVAPQTRVRMADGRERPIAEICAGDRLLADASGRLVEVKSVITGEEDGSMWRLVAGDCELLATHNHPVMTPDGPIAISELEIGEEILSHDGLVRVTENSAEPYVGKVVNLVLQALDGTIPSQGDHFLGGGFVIGDNSMQNALANAVRAKDLPVEWQIDFDNAIRLASGQRLVAAA